MKDSIDLHGKRGDEVEAIIDNFLYKVSSTNLKRAKIITGKGSGVVQKIVINYLKLAKYQWSYEQLSNGKQNTGVIIIHLS